MKFEINTVKSIATLIIIINSLSISSQKLEIEGKTVDKNTNEPLLFVNIHIKNTSYGTISNEEGEFRLKIPQKNYADTIVFSCLGYEKKECFINEIIQNSKIELVPSDFLLSEVIIIQDSTLLTLLKRAYGQIPKNYPTCPTKLKGFYKESVKTSANNYLYFSEAVIETYKTGYKNNSDFGNVRILKSLSNEFPGIKDLGLRFYGGVFIANEGDFVKKRYAFINPKYFYKYRYSLIGITKTNENEIYIIGFDTNNDSLGGTKKGKLYIDKTSLAYIGCEYESTDRGLENADKERLFRTKSQKYKKSVRYVKIDDKWHLNYIISDEIFYRKTQSVTFELKSEYVTNEIYSDTIKPIPLIERIEFGDIFSEKAKKYYSDDYWGEYNILKKDSSEDDQIKLLYDTLESKKLLTQRTLYTKKNNILKILSNFEVSYGISYYSIAGEDGIYNVNYRNNNTELSFSEELNKLSYNINYLSQIRYNFNYRWSFNYAIQNSLSKKSKTTVHDLGMSCRMLLNKRSRPIFIGLSLLISYNSYARNFSIYENNAEFEFGNKNIDAEKLQFRIGNNTLGIKSRIAFEYQLKRRLYLITSANYYFPLYAVDKLYLEEKSGFFLTRKKANLSLTNDKLDIQFNNEKTKKSHIIFNNYSIDLGIMLKF
jgi:hypothetical protein